jgi:PAS domain S-box-containing protein
VPICQAVSPRSYAPRAPIGATTPCSEPELRTPAPTGAEARSSVSPAAVLVADVNERILHADGEAFARHGLDTGGWIGRALTELLPAEAAAILLPRYRAALTGTAQSFQYRTHDATRTYHVQMAPVPDRAGAIGSVVAVLQDTTEPLRVTAELARSEARLREAERMVGVGSWELILGTGEMTLSPGFARLLGLPGVERLSVDGYVERVHADDRERVHADGRECLASGSTITEHRVVWPDGTVRTLSARAELVIGGVDEPPTMRGAALDVTEQREIECERLAAENLFRNGFDAAPIGMVLSDPADGHCVRVNDALCRLVQRPREELIGRSMYGFTHPDDRDALWAARERIRAGELSDLQCEQRFVRPDGTVVWVLLHLAPVRRADGSVRAFHSQLIDITERKHREARLEDHVGDAVWLGRIRAALDEKRLVLYTQPIVNLTTGATVQHELLLRMRAEDGTIIAPGEFLPVAERYGLISEIDRWVIREAVRIAAGGTPTEFNLSARSVDDPLIIRELATAIEETGVDPSLLVVEVTETALLGRIGIGREFAQRVTELGCRLALDDFGTGFSSLSYLKHLPADYLKIDIEFVRELTSNETDRRVVRGIVGLAREFDQVTIAEGVEDEATLIMLKDLGVDQAQGYLFARPTLRSEVADAGEPPRCQASAGGPARLELVRAAFDAFAARDVPAILSHCRPDVVLRALATSQLANRSEPYRGHDGVRAYLQDVAGVWDSMTFTPTELRETEESVIGFGRTEGRRGADVTVNSILWMVRVVEGQIASIEVFQAEPRPPSSAPTCSLPGG